MLETENKKAWRAVSDVFEEYQPLSNTSTPRVIYDTISYQYPPSDDGWDPADTIVPIVEGAQNGHSEQGIYGPFAARDAYGNEKTLIVAIRQDVVLFEDGSVGPKPEHVRLEQVERETVTVAGSTLFESCEDKYIHCDEGYPPTYEIYDITGLTLRTEKMTAEYTVKVLELTFQYTEAPSEDWQLAPQTLRMTGLTCDGSIWDIYPAK